MADETCPKCQKTFSRKDARDRHLKTVHATTTTTTTAPRQNPSSRTGITPSMSTPPPPPPPQRVYPITYQPINGDGLFFEDGWGRPEPEPEEKTPLWKELKDATYELRKALAGPKPKGRDD